MAEWWESAPVVKSASTQPASDDWWSAAPVVAPRETMNFRGLRIARQGDKVETNPEPTDDEQKALLEQSLVMAGPAISLGAGLAGAPALGAAGGAALNLASGNVGGAMLDVGLGMLPAGGGWLAKMGAKALMARRIAKVAEEAEAVAPAVGRAYQGIPSLMKIGAEGAEGVADAASVARNAEQAGKILKMPYRLPAQSASTVAEQAAPAARTVAEVVTEAPAVRKLAPIPAKGNVKMPTVYTKPPMQGPKLPNAAQEALKAKQLEAARAAGMDVGEAFGTAPVVAQKAEQAAEGALMTRLRASVMMKKDPAGLVNEVSEKAAELAGKGLSREQVGAQIEALYGLTPDKIKQLAAVVAQ